jgi:hypothetical protein
MPTIDALRNRMLDIAGVAREQHIDGQMEKYASARAEFKAILEQLRDLYKQNTSSFDERLLSDIRTAKICARFITRADLDRKSVERERQSIRTAHAEFLRTHGLPNAGTRLGLGFHRVTHCYNCKNHLDNAVDIECSACRWIICQCGACGCGYSGAV